MSNSTIACLLIILSLTSLNQAFFNPSVFEQMAQLGTNKASSLAKGDQKAQLEEFKKEYPSIFNVLQDQAGDQECEKIRIDCFTDCKFTFEGIKELNLSHEDAYRMTDAIFSKCVGNCKELCPL